MKLYDLAAGYRVLAERIEEMENHPDGPPPDGEDAVLKAAFDSIEDAIEVKAESCVVLMKEWQAEALSLKAEEERLTKRRKALENRAEKLRSYLLFAIVAIAKNKLKTKLFSLTVIDGKESVELAEDFKPEALDKEFVLRTEIVPDKKAMKTAMQVGVVIQGAKLVTGDKTLQVR